jgi:hypothetical protein
MLKGIAMKYIPIFFVLESIAFYFLVLPLLDWQNGHDTLAIYYNWRENGFIEFGNFRHELIRLWEPAIFYPINWIYYVTDTYNGMAFEYSFHFGLIGLGASFLYHYGYGRSIPASLFVAVILQFSGPFVAHLRPGHFSNLATVAWVPFIWLFIILIHKKPTFTKCALLSLLVSLHFLAGHVQYMYYFAICIGFFALITFDKIKTWFIISGCYCVSICACLFQIYPAFIYITKGDRFSETLSYVFSSSFYLPVEYLTTALKYTAMGSPAATSHAKIFHINFHEGNCFFGGIGGLILIILGANNKKYISITAVMLMALILSFGVQTHIYDFMYQYFPFYKNFRGNSKFIFFAVFFGSILAAGGFDILKDFRNA